MEYTDCKKYIEKIVKDIFDEAIEDEDMSFTDDMSRAAIQVELMSQITYFVHCYFGLEPDKNKLEKGNKNHERPIEAV